MSYLNEYDDDQIKMHNGRYVMNALSSLNCEATESELLKHIATTGHPQNLDKEELKRILNYGVINGFIMKNNNKYLLPRLVDVHQSDGLGVDGEEDCGMDGIEETQVSKKINVIADDKQVSVTTKDADGNEVGVALSFTFLHGLSKAFMAKELKAERIEESDERLNDGLDEESDDESEKELDDESGDGTEPEAC